MPTPLLDSLPSWMPDAPTSLLLGGGVGLYVAARFGTRAIVGPRGHAAATAGQVALGHWVPIVAVTVTAVALGRPDIGLGVAFASAVASLALAVGMISLLAPADDLPPTRRAWPFVLPAGLLALLAGFGASLSLVHAVMFALLGATVLSVWRSAGRTSEHDAADLVRDMTAHDPAADPAGIAPLDYAPPVPPHRAVGAVLARVAEWAVAAALAVVAARLLVSGTIAWDAASRTFRAGVLTAGAISPLLVLPLLAAGTDLAQRGRTGEALSSFVGVALLNVFGLVPLLVVVWWVRQATLGEALLPAGDVEPGGLVASLADLVGRVPPLPMAHTIWRIDTVVLTVLGLILLPAATGRWRLGRLEALALLVGYAAFLAVKALVAVTG